MNQFDKLSREVKLGQLFMVGFDETEFTPERRSFFDKYRPGGVILFSRNFVNKQQLIKLCSDLHNWAAEQSPSIPLLISVDHEGGRVQRFRKDFTVLPPPGTISSPDEAYKTGQLMGTELKSAGINMNMMPLLDVNSNPDNPIIGDRSFGDTPKKVIELALPFIKGMQEKGVIAVGKHFPGHGDTSLDSHKTLPTVDADKATLNQRELVPFQAAIDAGIPTIMTAHVLYPAWDKDNPGTLSPFILNNILRQKMDFNGIIISDDLLMGAVKSDNIAAVTCRAFSAGVDLLLICAEPELQAQAFQGLLAAYNKGLIGARLEESLQRLFLLKNKFLIPDYSGNG